MKFCRTLNLFIFLAVYSLNAWASDKTLPSAETLLANWKNAIYTNSEESKITLLLVDPASNSQILREAKIWYKSHGKGDSRILMRFSAPASIRGTAFLSLRKADQNTASQWLYFPSYGKARRLSAHQSNEPFLDSDFNNGDISFEHEKAFNFKIQGSKTFNGDDVYILEGTLKDSKNKNLLYSREVLFIRKSDNLNIQTQFYDRDGSLMKTLTVNKWTKYGNRWAVDKIEVRNEVTKHRSVIEFISRNLKADPADHLFTMSELESGR